MKKSIAFLIFISFALTVLSQKPISGYLLSSRNSLYPNTYLNNGTTYNWSVAPQNSIIVLEGFTIAGEGYKYDSAHQGTVKIKRADNANTSGNFTLLWSAGDSSSNVYNMFAGYQNNMEDFLNHNIFNQGAENLFDNTSLNNNDIERLDWILSSGFSSASPAETGFAVLDRGNDDEHDPFCIAAITSLDAMGNPASYSKLIRINTSDYADPLTAINYRVLSATYTDDLVTAGTGTETEGGVFIPLDDLGIAASTTVYGYSLFAPDLPVFVTAADLVDYTNTTNFLLNTGDVGGIDLAAIMGIYTKIAVLPLQFIDFTAIENNNIVTLKWKVANEENVVKYEVERSSDGIHFLKTGEQSVHANSINSDTYTTTDQLQNIQGDNFYYRIKQLDNNGNYFFSKIISIRLNNTNTIVAIYPNPARKILFINIQSSINAVARIIINTIDGKKLIQKEVQLTRGNNSFTIDDINNLPPGTYSFSVYFSPENKFSKIFIKK